MDNEELAKDLTSESFIKAFKNINKYKDQGFSFSSWLYRIASNEVNSYYRKNKKKQTVGVTDFHIGSLVEEFSIDNNKLSTEFVSTLFDQLKPVEVNLLRFRFFEELSFKGIADFLDLKESTVKMKLYRILERISNMKMIKKFKTELQ